MTNKTQTTRTAIRAIVNRKNSQIVFIDTPGIHKPKTKLGTTMIETAFGTISEVDVILFMIEATSKEIGKGDSRILEKLKETNKKVIDLEKQAIKKKKQQGRIQQQNKQQQQGRQRPHRQATPIRKNISSYETAVNKYVENLCKQKETSKESQKVKK